MLNSLFAGRPERGFVAARLFRRVVEDEALADEVDDLVAKYYSQSGDVADVEAARKAIGGRAAEALENVFVVVASIPISDLDGAVEIAKSWKAKGFNSQVYESSSGYFGVTVGRLLPLREASALRTKALAEGAPEDTYLTPGANFTKMVYP